MTSAPRTVAAGRSAEYDDALDAYRQAGVDPAALSRPRVAALVVSGDRVLGRAEAPGVTLDCEKHPMGVDVHVVVAPGTRPEQPVHLCFGMLPPEGTLEIRSTIHVGADADVRFLVCCTFPRATRIRHRMDSAIQVDEGAAVEFEEVHFHGPHGGIEVVPRTRVVVANDARFVSSFSLVRGRVGVLDIGYDVAVGARGVADLTTKAFGRGDDRVRVEEVLHLNGEYARGVLKSRIAVRDSATSEVMTTAEGNAPHCRGHMDCAEIVRGHATASNVPHVVVRDEQARITHEAAIGTVNRTELETLMARGLDEDDAVDVIIRGMLR
jgi:hypothetical protein